MTTQSPALTERFMSKVHVDDNGCWLWTAGIASTGYGAFWDGQTMVSAHRFAWVAHNGPVPDGLDLDHLCRVRRCANPDHLEPVTRAENILRGDGPRVTSERQRAKTHCVHGHLLSGDNLMIRSDGRRACRTCKRASWRRWNARKGAVS